MARKAVVKKTVTRSAPVKKRYAVAWTTRHRDEDAVEFMTGTYDTIEKAKREAEDSFDEGDVFYVFEVKLVSQSEPSNRIHWKDKK